MPITNEQTKIIKNFQKLFKLEETGFSDQLTASAIRNYQLTNGLYPSGVLDKETINRIEKREGINLTVIDTPDEPVIKIPTMNTPFEIPNISTDLLENFVGSVKIKDEFLPISEYINTNTKKTMIFLHHTAGNGDPSNVIKDWRTDTRGKVGTHYVIGGQTTFYEKDGQVLRAIPDSCYGYHLGNDKGKSLPSSLTTNSISIEICNFGFLEKRGSSFFTYVNSVIDPKNVITLEKPFRGYLHWHKYTDAQIKSLISLIKKIESEHSIDIEPGLVNLLKKASTIDDIYKAFEYNDTLVSGTILKGIWSHTNCRREKFDIYPHPKLIEELKKL